jgi:hypothetical protein
MAAPSIRTGTAPKTLSTVKCWVRGVHPIILFGIQTTQRWMRRSDRSVIAQWPAEKARSRQAKTPRLVAAVRDAIRGPHTTGPAGVPPMSAKGA